jgi:integrative and conjugative element protein (TIGR02256 family)
MSDFRILLPQAILAEMQREAQHQEPNESGGVLMGYADRTDPNLIKVTAQIGPGPNATHRRHRFEPDAAWQCDEVARCYEQSGRIATYLGDWHSHPGGSARPSRLDRKTARNISRSPEARVPHPLMLILAGSEEWAPQIYRYRLWRLRRGELDLL